MALSKKQNQKIHFLKRMRQRFAFQVSESEYRRLVSNIESGLYPVIERQSNRVVKYKVNIGGFDVAVIYDSARKNLVTALPMGVG